MSSSTLVTRFLSRMKKVLTSVGRLLYMAKRERTALAADLNTLLVSPTFEAWQKGCGLDLSQWLEPRADGKTPAVILSVAHLDDEERTLVLGVVMEELLFLLQELHARSRMQRFNSHPLLDRRYADSPASLWRWRHDWRRQARDSRRVA